MRPGSCIYIDQAQEYMDQEQTRTLTIASGHCSIWTGAGIYRTRTLMIVTGYCFIWTRDEIYKTRIIYIFRPGPSIYRLGSDEDLNDCSRLLLHIDQD
jgi:hypothetical protein